MMFYIYHIPGIKIGCSTQPKKRVRAQGYEEFEILEVYSDGWLAGDRELELQKEYGYKVDCLHYMKSRKNRYKVTKQDASNGGKKNRRLTLEQAQEIRDLYATGEYTYRDLAKMYGIYFTKIGSIIKGHTYFENFETK